MRRAAFIVALGLWLFAPALAWGSETAATTWLGLPRWVWAWANLAVFWGLLWRFAGPPLTAFLKNRRLAISSDLGRAQQQRTEAAEMTATLGGKIDELRAEMERLLERSEDEGRRERDQVLEQAEQERERLLAQTRAEIDNRVTRAKHELSRLTVDLAGELARERVRARLGPEDRSRIFERNLERLRERAS